MDQSNILYPHFRDGHDSRRKTIRFNDNDC